MEISKIVKEGSGYFFWVIMYLSKNNLVFDVKFNFYYVIIYKVVVLVDIYNGI